MPTIDSVSSVLAESSEFRIVFTDLRKAFDEYLNATFQNLSSKEREAHWHRFRRMLRTRTDAKLVRQLFVNW